MTACLSREDTGSTDSLDLFLSLSGEKPGLDDNGLLGQSALAQNLEESGPGHINDWRLLGVLLVLGPGLFGHQRPQFVHVDGRTVLVGLVGVHVEVPHAHLTEVTGMVLVEVDAVVMLTSSVSATSGMLAVLADAAVTVGNVAAQLAGLLLVCRHASATEKSKHILKSTSQTIKYLCRVK